MKQVIRGYKVGRNFKFYDLEDVVSHEVISKISKDELAKEFEKNPDEFLYLKWQDWKDGKILRITNNYEIVTEESDNSTVDSSVTTKKVVRATKAINLSLSEHSDALPKSRVVGKLGSKSGYSKRNTDKSALELAIKESGYSMNNVYEQRALRSSIDYSKMNTLEDLFIQMTKEFGLYERIEVYRKTVESSKADIKLNKKLSEISPNQLSNVQNFLAVYMMNMANKQINEAYNKYKLEIMSIS